MLDLNMVTAIAIRDGYYELADYLLENKKQYSAFILTGKTHKNDEEDSQ